MVHAPNFWPTQSAGPASPTAPITEPLLRIIAGDPRTGANPIDWLNDQVKFTRSTSLSLAASLKEDCSELIVSSPDGKSSSWFDFTLPIEPDKDAHITFTVSLPEQPAIKYTSVVLLSEFAPEESILTRPLFDTDHAPVATLRLRFLRISPHSLSQAMNRVKTPRAFAPRFTGHRGMGSSNPEAPLRPRENTLGSFLSAACANPSVNTIELDVQLTADHRTVIHHDWFFYPGGPKSQRAKYDRNAVRIPIHNLTFEQFDKLVYPTAINARPCRDDDDDDDLSTLVSTLPLRIVKERKLPQDILEERARLLFDVCESLPEHVQFLIEIKYPSPDMQHRLNLTCPEKNTFLNIMLDDLFTSMKTTRRHAAFLCFDPDVCTMLSFKQNVFPVYFSNAELFSTPCDHIDSRRIDLRVGFDFVKAHCLDGLMLFCRLVELHPDIIASIIQENVPILTYGKDNCKAAFVRKQFNAGIRGVIADDVLRLVKDFETLEQAPPSEKEGPFMP